MTKSRWIAVSVLVLVLGFAALLAFAPSVKESAKSPLVGKPAPAIRGESLSSGPVDLGEYRGRWTVVNFFATWCVECRREHPELVKFTEKYSSPNDPAVVAVAFDRNDIPATRSFFAQYGGDWPVVPDTNGAIALSYGVRGLPESFILDPNGVIAARITGEIDSAGLEAIISGQLP